MRKSRSENDSQADMTGAFDGKHVLITGGLGFIGSNLARRLVELGADVLLVDSLVPEYGGNLFNISGLDDAVRVNISDVRDVHSMRYLVQGQHFLFSLAGQTSHLDSMVDPNTDLDINCRAQLSILEACRKYNPQVRIAFASTRQIYGKPERLPVDESHPLRPADVNGINKMAAELYYMLYNQVYELPAVALRLTNTYGPGMRVKDARQTFLGDWIRCIVEERPFEVWEGEQLRDFTYVDDAVGAFVAAVSDDRTMGNAYNLGGDRAISLIELAKLLVKVAKRGEFTVRPFPENRKRIDIGDYYADFSAIRRTTGWEPKVTLEEGLDRTLAFYRDHLKQYL